MKQKTSVNINSPERFANRISPEQSFSSLLGDKEDIFTVKALLTALAIASGSCLAGSTAYAVGEGIYVGGRLGTVKFEDSDFKDERTVKSAFIGAGLNPYLGLQVDYIDFGNYGSGVFSAETTGFAPAVIGSLPLNEAISLYAKGGQLFWETDVDVDVLGFNDSLDGNEFFYGVGANLKISETLAVQLEYDRFKVDLDEDEIGAAAATGDFETDVDTASVGLEFGF